MEAAPRIVVDGEDSERGRGLLLISALHHAAPQLGAVSIDVLNAFDPSVRSAVELLRWESGLRIHAGILSPEPCKALMDARLFVAIGVSGTDHMPLHDAASCCVPTLTPVQFPAADAEPGILTLSRAAHDPAELARVMVDRMGMMGVLA